MRIINPIAVTPLFVTHQPDRCSVPLLNHCAKGLTTFAPLYAHSVDRVDLQEMDQLRAFEKERRVYLALGTAPMPNDDTLDGVFNDTFTWLTRGDEKIVDAIVDSEVISSNYDRFLGLEERGSLPPINDDYLDGYDYFLHPPIHSSRHTFNHSVVKSTDETGPITLNSGQSIKLDANQAEQMMKLIDDVQLSDLKDDLKRRKSKHVSAEDHLTLWIKAGSSYAELKSEIIKKSGDLGWRLMERFILSAISSGQLDSRDFSMSYGYVINMAEWRDRYIFRALREVGISSLFKQVLRDPREIEKGIPALLEEKIEQRISDLIDQGRFGRQLLTFGKFKSLANVQAFNAVALFAAIFHKALNQTDATKRVADQIDEALGEMPESRVVQSLKAILHNGWADIQVLDSEAYREVMLDTYGIDKSGSVAGLAKGGTVYVKGLSIKEKESSNAQLLTTKQLSTCIHELRHVMDWLQNPEHFLIYSKDSVATYTLERRAFHIQNEFERAVSKSGEKKAVPARFKETKDIYAYIQETYASAQSNSQFKSANQIFKVLEQKNGRI